MMFRPLRATDPATDDQIRYLVNLGFDREDARDMNVRQAARAIDAHKDRPFPDEWQQTALERYGYTTHQIKAMSREGAAELITRLVKDDPQKLAKSKWD